jgi:CBS domain-containing protein
MHTDVTTVSLSCSIKKAAERLSELGIGCLPVTKQGRLVGIVTRGDLLRLVARRPIPRARANGRPRNTEDDRLPTTRSPTIDKWC